MTPTQIKLIDAAEREFAERGFHGASIRGITARAQVNIAAVNYHFGSKETLFVEMIRHRVEPVNALRLRLLEGAKREAPARPLPLRRIVDILLRPLLGAFLPRPDFLRAMGRGLTEESRFMAILYEDVLSEVIARFRVEFDRSLPDLSAAEMERCLHYLASTISGVMLQQKRVEGRAEKQAPDPDAELDSLVTFVTGGIEAVAQESVQAPSKSLESTLRNSRSAAH